MKEFYIKNIEALKLYGFQENYHGVSNELVFIYNNRTPSMWVNKQTKRLTIQSPSREAIYIICEMYKSGILEIVDIDEKQSATIRMNLTPEEAELVHNFRNGKRNE